MNAKGIFILIVVLFAFSNCSAQSNFGKKDLSLFIGTWKIENRDTYEEWEVLEDGSFSGSSYEMVDGQKVISETLRIKFEDDKVIYGATVTNQNSGAPILFILNKTEKDQFSFENLLHDFPKKIQYQAVSETEIQVRVLGDDDKGFSYKLLKQSR